MPSVTFGVGMTCEGCSGAITRILKKVEAVDADKLQIDMAAQKVTVEAAPPGMRLSLLPVRESRTTADAHPASMEKVSQSETQGAPDTKEAKEALDAKARARAQVAAAMRNRASGAPKPAPAPPVESPSPGPPPEPSATGAERPPASGGAGDDGSEKEVPMYVSLQEGAASLAEASFSERAEVLKQNAALRLQQLEANQVKTTQALTEELRQCQAKNRLLEDERVQMRRGIAALQERLEATERALAQGVEARITVDSRCTVVTFFTNGVGL